jgi:hypothetical protein
VRSWGRSTAEQDEVWARWRRGQSLGLIARQLAKGGPRCGRSSPDRRRAQPPRRRAQRSLSMAEREESSRGGAAGEPCRPLAARLGRAPSAGSRELARDGGRGRYRLRSLTPLAAGGPSGQAGQAGDRASGGGGGGGQAGPAVVARADRRVAGAGLPREDPVLGCRTRPSTCRCWSTAAGRLVASSSVAWARVGRCASRGPSGCPRAVASCATPSTSASDPPRPLPGRCPAIGKATWCSASGPARSGPGWSATAARCGCFPPQPLHRSSHAPSADRRRPGAGPAAGPLPHLGPGSGAGRAPQLTIDSGVQV